MLLHHMKKIGVKLTGDKVLEKTADYNHKNLIQQYKLHGNFVIDPADEKAVQKMDPNQARPIKLKRTIRRIEQETQPKNETSETMFDRVIEKVRPLDMYEKMYLEKKQKIDCKNEKKVVNS